MESGIGPRHPAAGEGLGEASGELAIPGRGAGMEGSHVDTGLQRECWEL